MRYPAFSPDGRWIAYASQEAGPFGVYVRPYPGPGGKWQVSTAGGVVPIWSRNGRELFYMSAGGGRIWAVPYTAKGDSFAPGRPTLRLESAPVIAIFGDLDLMPDGKRFIAIMPTSAATPAARPTHVTFLLNFADELRRWAPQGK